VEQGAAASHHAESDVTPPHDADREIEPLPEGAVGGLPTDPQGDENRDPANRTDPAAGAASRCRYSAIAAVQRRNVHQAGKTRPHDRRPHEVRAIFANPTALQDAVGKLEMSGFNRADLSLVAWLPGCDDGR
jgi:hypothetical protein